MPELLITGLAGLNPASIAYQSIPRSTARSLVNTIIYRSLTLSIQGLHHSTNVFAEIAVLFHSLIKYYYNTEISLVLLTCLN